MKNEEKLFDSSSVISALAFLLVPYVLETIIDLHVSSRRKVCRRRSEKTRESMRALGTLADSHFTAPCYRTIF